MHRVPNGHRANSTGTSLDRHGISERISETSQEKNRQSKRQLTAIEADGTINARIGDAPGQNCIYIVSGQHNEEFYRLGTFAQFPLNVPIKPPDLAEAGFYFTGFRDRVKCFSCGIGVENWIMGDYGLDQKWHKEDCKMKYGHDTTNIPIPKPNFRSLLRQYLGEHKPVQGIDSRILGHRNYSQASSSNNDITDVTSNFRGIEVGGHYPSLILANIVAPEHKEFIMRINLKCEAERRQTFAKWPTYPAPLLPSELAKQGLFYLGNLDRAQCFSCSGVLRNWSQTDDVSEQHRKHFPECRMVRQVPSGNIPMTDQERRDADEADQRRIAQLAPSNPVEPPDPSEEEQRYLAEHFPCRHPANPHMREYQFRLSTFDQNWPNRIRATPEQIAKAGFFFLGDKDRTKCFYCNGGLQNWEENDEPFTEHARWFPGCEFVLKKKGHEFVRRIAEQDPNLNRPTIRNAVSYDIPPMRCGAMSNVGTASGQPVIHAKQGVPIEPNTVSSTNEASASSLPGEDIAKNLLEIKKQNLCRKCKTRNAEIVMLPCGHLCSCEECAKKSENCFICHRRVTDILKTYRA
ncbi:baculoviral IAP repeat-containing protein 7-B-like [Styela clava]